MIRKLLAGLFLACILTAGASPAYAGPFGVIGRFLHPATFVAPPGGPSSPNVLPGAGPVNTTFLSITPANYGSPGDTGYNTRGWCRWDRPSLIEVGLPGINGTRQFGITCIHEPTDVEKIAGVANNINYIRVRIDKGAWYTITGASTNADELGETNFNFTVNSQNFSDGLHQVDCEGVPFTGPSIICEGALSDASGFAPTGRISAAKIDNGSGGAGNILTITGNVRNTWNVTGTLCVTKGWLVEGVGVGPNTFLTQTNADNPSRTGTCDSGTYTVGGAPQLVAETKMTVGNQTSLYFISDFNSTLRGAGKKTVVYMASAADGGSDINGNSGLDASHPKLTPFAAAGVISSQSGNSGMYGGTVCILNAQSVLTESGSGTVPTATLGWLTYQSAAIAPCVHPGDAGMPKMHFDGSNRYYGVGGATHIKYNGIQVDNAPSTYNGGVAVQLWAENTLSVGHVYQVNGTATGTLGAGGVACINTTLIFNYNGGCSAMLIDGGSVKYISEDGFGNNEFVHDVTVDAEGPSLFWTTATATSGSKTITGVTVPAGYTIAQIFPPGSTCSLSQDVSCIGVVDSTGAEGTNCFPAGGGGIFTSIVSVNEAAHSILTDQFATCSVTGMLANAGVHADGVQFNNTAISTDIIYHHVTIGITLPGWYQGWFLEASGLSGIYLGDSNFKLNINTPEHPISINGGNDHLIQARNLFTAGGGTSRVDADANSNDETFIGEQCINGSFWTGAGTNIRRKASPTNACYTTTTP